MTKTVFVAAGLAALVSAGCTDLTGEEIIYGSGRVVSEQRPAGPFTAISNATEARVEILQGSTERIRVRAEENIIRHVRTRVENGVLRIYTDRDIMLRPSEPITVELDVRVLDRIISSGSGVVHAPLLDARRLEVVASGYGDVDLPSLLADTLVVQLSSSAEVHATGTVVSLRVVHSGSGRVETRELQSRTADVTLSGAGPAVVRVRDRLRAIVSGSGSVRYYGSPIVEQTVTGTGRVERAGS